MFQITWTQKAEKQLNQTLLYWNNRNKSNSYSKKLLKEIKKTEIYLTENPNSGITIGYNSVLKISVLRVFSIIYKLKEKQIMILAFWDNRRNPDNLEL